MSCDRTYKWMSYREAASYMKRAKEAGVSRVAREEPRGFMVNFKKNPSIPSFCRSTAPGGSITWGQKRKNFISRHLAQYKKACAGGKTCNRERQWLAMIMWAYKAPKLH